MVTVACAAIGLRKGMLGTPDRKSILITLEDNTGWRYETIIGISAGDAAHEAAEISYAVEKLMQEHGKTGPWRLN